ncbi:hypothetical protein HYH03_017774 [Edaphochlamys debaryana]|uniref:Uncharacterized protein n=1 Tax=Edaphochlamys debaryana TaxID=47281 RepID=A0A836BNJ7_9CHLO|nr:hypothetical protein HYH03_017774 [Edaphochlamys debaryana]|eukprot:KAG2483326.1 hypothetical protein HYH03_017774 [Edaphochlamys debaryana]
MIPRLRQTIPVLRGLGSLSSTTVATHVWIPPPVRRWLPALLASSERAADGASTAALSTSAAAEAPAVAAAETAPAEPVKKTRRKTVKSKAESEPAADATPAEGTAGEAPAAAPKRRATSRTRKTAAATADANEAAPAPSEASQAIPAAPKKARRTTKTAAAAAEAEAAELAAVEAAAAEAAEAAPAPAKKRASRSKKAPATAAAAEAPVTEEEPRPRTYSVRDLPFEPTLVLPRKAEQLLVALGLRRPLFDPETATREAAGAGLHLNPPSRSTPAGQGGAGVMPVMPGQAGGGAAVATQLRNVFELRDFLGWRDVRDLASPLLAAQYQGYLGDSPDYLYDLYCLDFDPPFLASDAVRAAVQAAAAAPSRAAGPLSATGSPPDSLLRAAVLQLDAAAVEAQEGYSQGLTAAQVELFLLDWASARLAGVQDTQGPQYLARRCAALELCRPVVLERLHAYLGGASLREMASLGGAKAGKPVRTLQALEGLVEGLKAGVALDRERLLADFTLSPSDPMGPLLPLLRALVAWEAAFSADPGGSRYYTLLGERLKARGEIRAAMTLQESRWKEAGEKDPGSLLVMQLRLVFHLARLDRFAAEQQQRAAAAAAAGAAGAGA